MNKNQLFNGIINNLINYNLEGTHHNVDSTVNYYSTFYHLSAAHNSLLSKSTLLNAFIEGFQCDSCVEYFINLFLSILNQGLLKAHQYLSEMKVNEFSGEFEWTTIVLI